MRPSSTSWTSSWTATPRGGPEPQPLPNTCQIFRCLFLVPYSAWLARLRLIRSPKLQGESGRPVRGSSRSRSRTPASAGHSAQPSTGRDKSRLMVVCRLLRKRPDPTAADNVPLEATECSDDLAESSSWDRDFEVVMLASDASDEQIEGPPGRGVPRGRNRRQSLRDFSGSPCRPEPVAFLVGKRTSSHLRQPSPRWCVRRVCHYGIGRRHARARPGAGRSQGQTTRTPRRYHPGAGHPAHWAFAARPRPLRAASDRSQPHLRPLLTKSNQPPTSAVRGWPHYYTDAFNRDDSRGEALVWGQRKVRPHRACQAMASRRSRNRSCAREVLVNSAVRSAI